MGSTRPLPTLEQVAHSFSGLVGKSVQARTDGKPHGLPGTSGIVALYSIESGEVAAICFMDIPLASAMGSALMMIPPDEAAKAARSGRLTESMTENVAEVMNICAALFNNAGGPHVTLSSVRTLPTDLPEDATGLIKAPGARQGFAVDVEDYVGGSLTLLVGG